jgi:ribonuclease HI
VKQPLRRFDEEKRRAIGEEVHKLMAAGFIKEVFHPEWLANPMLVKKKGGKWRMCVDYTGLNKACPKVPYPLPRIDQIVDSTAGCETLSFIDAYSGYHQIKMKESDQLATSFITPFGMYCYTTMPFGLKNAGATYQRCMNHVFGEHIGRTVETYVDDIVIKTRKASDLLSDLKVTFGCLRAKGVKLNPEKCVFGVPRGMLLGFIVSERGIEANPEKITAITNMGPIKDLKGVQRVMGCLAALSRFISCLGEKGLPLYRLLRKSECFTWTPEAEEALGNLKALLTNVPILVPPSEGEALLVYVATTTQVVSAAIVVERQEERHALLIQRSVYFISEVLSETKIRYPQIQKLLYAVILTRRKLRHYFESHPVTVVSSFPLGEIIQCREASGTIAKWTVELMGETLSFAPRKAIKSQVLADFLAEWVDTQLPTAPIQLELWTMYFDGSLMKTRAGAGLLFISPLGKHVRYVLHLHFLASNNVAEYEALVNGLRIAVELGVRRLDARGDSQLVIDQVMKNSHCRDQKMEAYCDEVRRLEDKFYGLELNHVARRYNEIADELAKIASGRTTVPPDVFSRDIYQPSVKLDDAPEPDETSAQPEVLSAAEGEALRIEGERNGVAPNQTGRPRTCNISSEQSCPSTRPKLGDWLGAPSRSFCWVMKTSCTTTAPRASSNEAYPSPKDKSCYKKFTQGLAVTMQHLGPSWETLSDKVSTGRPRWPTPLGLYASAEGVNSTRDRRTCPLKPCRQYPSLGHLPYGVWTSSVPYRRHLGASRTCWSPSTNSPSGSRSDP